MSQGSNMNWKQRYSKQIPLPWGDDELRRHLSLHHDIYDEEGNDINLHPDLIEPSDLFEIHSKIHDSGKAHYVYFDKKYEEDSNDNHEHTMHFDDGRGI